MARANRTGVPGLVLIESGPHAGRYRLGFRYTCPVERRPKRLSKLYPSTLKTAAVKADAKALVNDALTGKLAQREAEQQAEEAKVTIASIAADVVKLREQDGKAKSTLFEFRSIVLGDDKQKGERRKGGHIVRHLGALAPHELDSVRLAAFVDELRGGGAAPRTIRNVFKVLGQFIRIVRVRKLDPQLTSDPLHEAHELGLALPSKTREAPKRVPWSILERLMTDAAIPLERQGRYAIALLAGLRDGEISGLTWADVQIATPGAEVLRVTKSYSARGGLARPKTLAAIRDVPAHPALVAALRVWRAGWIARLGREMKPDDPVFSRRPPEKGDRAIARHHRPFSAALLRRDLRKLGAEAEGEVDFHACRRSFASALEAAGVAHELIERLMGHELRSVLGQHYAAPDLGVLREAVNRLRLTSGARLRVVA
jgi:integrase